MTNPDAHRHPTRRPSAGGAATVSLAAALAIAAALSGCGRRGELLGTIGALDGGGKGAGAAAPRFTTPTVISSLSSPFSQDSDPTLTGDLLELFFTSDRGGSLDLWVSERASATAPWGYPYPVNDLNTSDAEYGAAISLDGLRIWFTTDRDGSPGRIWRALRIARDAPWSPAYPVTDLASSPGSPARDLAPSVDAVETTFMFSSNRAGSQGYDVYFSTRPGGGMPWATPALVPGINGPLDDWDPFVTQGGLVVFFTSTRQGTGDLFWAARQSTSEAFPTPQPLVDLNSTAYDSDATLSQDLTYIIFDSTRAGTTDLYEAHTIF